jgi:hypothetical protein
MAAKLARSTVGLSAALSAPAAASPLSSKSKQPKKEKIKGNDKEKIRDGRKEVGAHPWALLPPSSHFSFLSEETQFHTLCARCLDSEA